ncbi:glycine cleavage system protein H [Mariniphaga sp.]|uniref:glycine cleavage system protein H n=1 Tax=Mariniphaga sp. TaxID=1954475 RepID=UPI00356477E0
MEGFTYTNIFETKGIEYLVIISFFAVLVPLWMFFNRKTKPAAAFQNANRPISANSLRIPQGIFFSRYHTWAHLDKSGEALVGLDDLLVHITGNVKLTQFKKPGEQINKGELLAKIRYNGHSLDVLSPVSGEVQQTNSELEENPGLIKNDPYQLGWIYSIKPSNWKADTNSYYLAEDATNWAIQELERFKDFLAVSASKIMPQPVGVMMQDGGELVDKPLSNFPKEVWEDFQKEFLS